MSKFAVVLVCAVMLLFPMPGALVFAQDFSAQYHSAQNTSLTGTLPTSERFEASPQSLESRKPASRVLLLSNDQIVTGEVIDEGMTLQVRSEIGVLHIQKSDLVAVVETLSEVYHFKKSKTQNNSAEFLKLANWCVANGLQEEADYEFDRAILWAENRQLADALRAQKNAAMLTFEDYKLQKELLEQEKQKYGNWKKQVPQATFSNFKREIFPILSRNCSGIACHGGNSLNDFRLSPNPHNSDIDAAKNMQTVLGYIVPKAAEKSPLVLVPIAPHGRTKQIFTQRNVKQYEKLYEWVDDVAKEMSEYYPLDENDRIAAPDETYNIGKTASPTELGANVFASQNFDHRATFPAPGETLVDQPMTTENTPSSMWQGFSGVQSSATSQLPAQPLTQQSVQQPVQGSAQPSVSRGEFDFFNQRSIALPGTSPEGWPQPAKPAHLEQQKQVEIMAHGSTDAFEQGNIMQSLQRAPVDPFDPVLFNRQYHLDRVKNSLRQ